MDIDGSGSLDRHEVIDACRARGLPCAPERINAFFARADTDGDGKISRQEYSGFTGERVAELRAVFARMDENGDGRLTSDEMRRAARNLGFRVSTDSLRRAYVKADRDRDGTISFDEFVSFLLLLPDASPAAVFEAFSSFYMESASSEYAAPAEVVGDDERSQLLAVLASKVGLAFTLTLTLPTPPPSLATPLSLIRVCTLTLAPRLQGLLWIDRRRCQPHAHGTDRPAQDDHAGGASGPAEHLRLRRDAQHLRRGRLRRLFPRQLGRPPPSPSPFTLTLLPRLLQRPQDGARDPHPIPYAHARPRPHLHPRSTSSRSRPRPRSSL